MLRNRLVRFLAVPSDLPKNLAGRNHESGKSWASTLKYDKKVEGMVFECTSCLAFPLLMYCRHFNYPPWYDQYRVME
jgi:hypothetical protein